MKTLLTFLALISGSSTEPTWIARFNFARLNLILSFATGFAICHLLFPKHEDRFEFRTSSNGVIVWRLDRFTGQAEVSEGLKGWHTVPDSDIAFSTKFSVDQADIPITRTNTP